MAIQLSVDVRNARLNAIEVTIDASPVLEIYTGAPPANCAAPELGTLLASMTLPANWMGDAAAGSKALAGTWHDLVADDTGIAGHFRIYEATKTTCHLQGTCGIGTGDLQLDNTSVAAGQVVTITAFTLTDGNS